MDTNENTRNDLSEDVIVLGVASVETQGLGEGIESFGGEPLGGISDA